MFQALFIFCALYGYRAPLASKIDPSCFKENYVRAWVYFTDKGVRVRDYTKAISAVRSKMNPATVSRRILRCGTIDYADIPLKEDYIAEIEARGGLLIQQSKWLNAASLWIAKQDLNKIAELAFVYKITRVVNFQSPQETESALQDTTIFGLTYPQLAMFNIDQLHENGIFGSDVKVGFLDTGVRRKHTALNNTKIVAEHDFLSGDQIFMEDLPITEPYGLYSDLIFRKTSNRLDLFLAGDTVYNNVPVRDLLYTSSSDNGSTWTPLEKLTYNTPWPNPNWVTEIAVCGQDTSFVFYRDRYGIKYLIFTDTIINSGILTSAYHREPSAVKISDTVYIAYQGYGQNHHYLYLRKGTVSGFTSEMIIDSSLSNIKQPNAVKGNSALGIFYYIMPQDSIYFIKSPVPATVNTFSKTYIGQGKDAQATTSGDTILLIWKDTSNDPLFKISFAKSSDFGNSFSVPIFLTDDRNSFGKISLAKLNDVITVAWESDGKVYFSTSTDNGENFNLLDSLSRDFAYLPTLGTTQTDILKFYCQRGDSITDGYTSSDPQYNHPRHGTEMLGLIGGYLNGQYIGVAPGAQFFIAKTENPDSTYEFPVEEDTWVCGLEWLESKGADIISSSLGYTEGYDWPDDYDGKTSPASIAAYEATKRGVVVVNSAGNVSIPQIVVPADAQGVITVGGIDSLFNRWQFSGYFPTPDHSLKKPELMCLSAAPIVINPDSTDSYLYSFGTSGAAAMTSGICALILEGHPNWNVDSVRAALFNTASYTTTPSDSMGYGWPDAYAAFNYSPPAIDTTGGNGFLVPYPNPFILTQHDNIFLPFKLNQSATVGVRIYSITGRLIIELDRAGILLPGRYTDGIPESPNAAFIWDGKDTDGNEVSSGIYYCLLITHGVGNDLIKIAVIR